MDVRARVLALAASLALTACANGEPTRVLGYQTSAIPATSSTATAARGLETASQSSLRVPPRKSMADKVLAAIALERVTGRKPDPSRLAEAF